MTKRQVIIGDESLLAISRQTVVPVRYPQQRHGKHPVDQRFWDKSTGSHEKGSGSVSRNHKSAKAAGSRFNRLIADGLRDALGDPNIQVAPSWGAVDKGDIVNVRIDGHDLVIQTKDVARLSLPEGVGDAKVQAVNAGALAGLFVHKRKGTTDPMRQWVSCTVAELVALITKVPVTPEPSKGTEREHAQR